MKIKARVVRETSCNFRKKNVTEKNAFIIKSPLGLFLVKSRLESYQGHRLQVVKFCFRSILHMEAQWSARAPCAHLTAGLENLNMTRRPHSALPQ